MKDLTFAMLSTLLVAVVLVSPVQGQVAAWDEALTVANNWIIRIILREGHWGGYDWAQVEHIQHFTRTDKVLGYFCNIEPVGFIIVSLRKELVPVKAYSAESNLDPESDEGMADLLKMKMESILSAIEEPIRLYGVDAVPYVEALFEIDYRPAWNELCGQDLLFGEGPEFIDIDPFSQVGPLLTSNWHQEDPYNRACPEASGDCTQNRCTVGCVALAGAQIMRYWAWPPYHGDDSSESYDWCNMPNQAESSWSDNDVRVKSVAKLCHEIGDASGMDYCFQGCLSAAFTSNMIDAYKSSYHYSFDCTLDSRLYIDPDSNEPNEPKVYSPETWFRFIKDQINSNRPIHYSIRVGEDIGHSLVVDGWKEEGTINGEQFRLYHINYGFRDTVSNTWYTLDDLSGSAGEEKEKMLTNIYPVPAIGAELTEQFYVRDEEFNYRYFDRDANNVDVDNVVIDVIFEEGQNLQFLPGVTVICKGGFIYFESTNKYNTRLFSIKGTNTGGSLAGIKIRDGGIMLYPNGSVRFH